MHGAWNAGRDVPFADYELCRAAASLPSRADNCQAGNVDRLGLDGACVPAPPSPCGLFVPIRICKRTVLERVDVGLHLQRISFVP